MANADVRETAKANGVRLWQIADRLGVVDTHFSRKLRKEFSDTEKERIMGIIQALKQQREV